ncbi:MAG: hypothetical protein AB1744_05465 [Candidatus Zixiibacteriota bacterium]
MTESPLKVRISTPTEPILPGRGFYQLEEESLYVQVGPFSKERRFYSYIESETVRFDFDRKGRLIFIEVAIPRRHWPADADIAPPAVVEPADIRWLGFREQVGDPAITTSRDRSVVQLSFGDSTTLRNYYLAESVVAQITDNNCLAAVWITDIIDDLAGQEIASFRKKLRGPTRGQNVTA